MKELNTLIIEGILIDYNNSNGWGHIRSNDNLITVYFKNNLLINTGTPVRIIGSIKQENSLYPYILAERVVNEKTKRYLCHTSIMSTE